MLKKAGFGPLFLLEGRRKAGGGRSAFGSTAGSRKTSSLRGGRQADAAIPLSLAHGVAMDCFAATLLANDEDYSAR